MTNKKNNKSKAIKERGEYIVIKKCSSCEIEFEQLSPNNAYCDDCRKFIHKMWTEKRKKNMIYIFKPVIKVYDDELFYIGSTNNIGTRVSEHLCGHTTVSKKVSGKVFDIYYAEVEGVNRDELYFVEYYLIDKYKAIFGEKPIGNDVETYNTEGIATSRQAQLMEIADGLKFDEKYDVRRHRINNFNYDSASETMDIIKELSKVTN